MPFFAFSAVFSSAVFALTCISLLSLYLPQLYSMETETVQFRNYYKNDPITLAVREHYRKMRSRQTVEYVERMKKKYLTFDKPMHVWDAMEKLNALIDVSDPD